MAWYAYRPRNTSHANMPNINTWISLSNLNKDELGKDLPGVKVATNIKIPQAMAGPYALRNDMWFCLSTY